MQRHLAGRMLGSAFALALLGGCATPRVAAPPPRPPGPAILAPDTPRTDGATLYIRFVMQGERIAAVAAGTATDSDLMLQFQQHDANGTIVVVKQRHAQTIKLDVYLSADGTHFTPTSTCPLGGKSMYLTWLQPVKALAVRGARLVAPGTTAPCQ